MSAASMPRAMCRSIQTASSIASTSARTFSTSSAASTSKLSPLNKTTLKRQERLARGQGKGRRKDDANRLTLEEAGKVLKALHPLNPNSAYEINIITKPGATIQLNALRGRVFLPHSCASSTKSSYLVVFASGPAVAAARAAGADRVGGEEMISEILDGTLNPDKLITTPEMATLFTRNPQLARTLGPRGLMPSVKRGTVADDITRAVREARGGLDWKGDNKGVVRAAIGRLHFDSDKLQDNIHTLLASVSDIALGGSGSIEGIPARTKRPAITRVMLSSTQGPAIEIADL